MKITAKQLESLNVIIVLPQSGIAIPGPMEFFPLYAGDTLKGSNYVDVPEMRIRIFDIPALKIKFTFDPQKIRIQEEAFRKPNESVCAKEAVKVYTGLYKGIQPQAYGFNFDINYRMEQIIPQQEIMKHFVDKKDLESILDFGCQFTVKKEKGKRLETYFFKAVSPIEMRVHANFHFDKMLLPDSEDFQKLIEKCYTDTDKIFASMKF